MTQIPKAWKRFSRLENTRRSRTVVCFFFFFSRCRVRNTTAPFFSLCSASRWRFLATAQVCSQFPCSALPILFATNLRHATYWCSLCVCASCEYTLLFDVLAQQSALCVCWCTNTRMCTREAQAGPVDFTFWALVKGLLTQRSSYVGLAGTAISVRKLGRGRHERPLILHSRSRL